MKGVAIVIPTLDIKRGNDIAKLALATAGCVVPVRVIISHDKHRQGFTKTANKGMRLADPSEDVCLLNDDIFGFQHGWLRALRRVLYSNSRYGLTCPSGASAASPMKMGKPGAAGTQVVPQASFWCVLLKAEMIRKLGLLDERFIHYCSDNWYCKVMRRKKWQIVWVKSVYLKHKKHGSGMQQAWRKHDRAIYLKRLKK